MVLEGFLFAANMVQKRPLFAVQSVLVCGPLQLGIKFLYCVGKNTYALQENWGLGSEGTENWVKEFVYFFQSEFVFAASVSQGFELQFEMLIFHREACVPRANASKLRILGARSKQFMNFA